MRGKVSWRNFLFSTPMSAPSSLRSFLTPAKTQGTDAAVTTAPDIEATLLAEEQQVQWDVEDLVKALEEANRKREDLVKKRWDTQVVREKCEAEQHEADVKVRGKLLANAAVAEVQLSGFVPIFVRPCPSLSGRAHLHPAIPIFVRPDHPHHPVCPCK